MISEAVIWHDLECGRYRADLADWLELARAAAPGGPLLDVGAGTGRVALTARAGHEVIALERDRELACELAARADGLAVEVVCADACAFALGRAVALAMCRCRRFICSPTARPSCAARGPRWRPRPARGVAAREAPSVRARARAGHGGAGCGRYESAPTALRASPAARCCSSGAARGSPRRERPARSST